MTYAKRTDGNQSEIIAALRAVLPEASVHPASAAGDGFPDLAIGLWDDNYLVELKRPGGKLTKAQERWHARWKGNRAVCKTTAEVLVSILRQSRNK